MTKPPSRILLVDDDHLFAEVIQNALTLFGYAVVRASDGKEALKLYEPQTFHLVITDLIMPDMEGVELIMKLQQRDPSVRVIAMSGGGRNNPEAYLAVAERIGAVKTLAKPFPLETLRVAVAECLDES